MKMNVSDEKALIGIGGGLVSRYIRSQPLVSETDFDMSDFIKKRKKCVLFFIRQQFSMCGGLFLPRPEMID